MTRHVASAVLHHLLANAYHQSFDKFPELVILLNSQGLRLPEVASSSDTFVAVIPFNSFVQFDDVFLKPATNTSVGCGVSWRYLYGFGIPDRDNREWGAI